MDSVIISQGSKTYAHFFQPADPLNDLRSISKTVVSLAVGIALAQGLTLKGEKLTLDTPVWPYFEGSIQITNDRNRPRLNQVKIRHLLTSTIGHREGLMFKKDIMGRSPETLLDYIWNSDLVYKPGQHFVYSNAGPYLLSAIIQEELGESLADLVDRLLFKPLNITRFTWETYGKYCAAASGLRISNSDLHKIGRLFLEMGRVGNLQLVPPSWLEEMRTPKILTPMNYDETRAFPKYAYGYLLWICKDGTYFGDGTGGQYLIVLPKNDIVVTTLGQENDMRTVTECLRVLK